MKINTTLNNIRFWMNNARAYSLPMTILSWLTAFIYSIKEGGNILAGVLALVGICFVHLATNLIDDYFDYKILIKDEKFMNSAQNCKCEYLKNNKATPHELLRVILIFLSIASLIGAILFFISGPYVIILAFIALFIAIIYQKLSKIGLGDVGVIVAYGPLLFEGVFYVMTGTFSLNLLILSFGCALMTNTVLYTHMLMDYDGDSCSHKITLCTKFKSKEKALKFLLFFYISSYILLGFIALNTHNYFYFLPYLTLFQMIDLYNCLKQYNLNKTNMPKIYPWHYPLENWSNIKETPDAPFYFRFFYSRNIVTLFMLLACLAIILKH